MILIGQYDSPFVRRVGVALRLYHLPFEHRPWSVFGDAEKIFAYNPLMRVPTLVLADGFVLIDSFAILDYLDSLVPEDRALAPMVEPDRRHVLKLTAMATGLAEKAVSLLYDQSIQKDGAGIWARRCEAQITAVLEVMEHDRAKVAGPFWWGHRISHADIALTCALQFLCDVHGALFDANRFPALTKHLAQHQGTAIFQAISQPFSRPL